MGDIMKRAGAIFLIGFASILSVLAAVGGMGAVIKIDSTKNSGAFIASDTAINDDIDFLPFDTDEPSLPQSSSTQTGSTPSNSPTQSVTVLTPNDALGKVYNKFLTPYNAGLQYDNIYIKNSTGLDIDLKQELKTGSKIKLRKSSVPQVLIVHTHATEGFMSGERDYYTKSDVFNTTDCSKNVVRLGDIVSGILEKGGIGVIHNTTLHDGESYTGSYSRAEKTITETLKKYPTIKVVIDIHRDSVAQNSTDRVRPVVEINGKNAAQVMLVMGSNTGSVSGFSKWRENFRLAIKYQQTLENMYPGLARAMHFASKKYNQHLTTGSMLLEIGTDVNTLEQAEYSAELAANALLSVLKTLQ